MRSALFLVALGLAVPTAGLAHHSVSTYYDTTKNIAVSGQLMMVEVVNPHGRIELKADDGVIWIVETRGVAGMAQRGFDRETFKPGAKVTIDGAPARDGSKSMWLNRISTRGRLRETRQRF